jgi:hypothetical protein
MVLWDLSNDLNFGTDWSHYLWSHLAAPTVFYAPKSWKLNFYISQLKLQFQDCQEGEAKIM